MRVACDTCEPKEAVAFTAGPAGAFFAAGTIHAWLAADRTRPAIAAGISMGSVSAAAMQAALREIEKIAKLDRSTRKAEAARWDWLRRYVATLTDKPANVIWDAIPDNSDFFADRNVAPIRDLALGSDLPNDLRDQLRTEEMQANRRRFLLTSLGQWFGALPITVSKLATAIVRYVRWKEKYPGTKAWRLFAFLDSAIPVLLLTLWHIVRMPRMFSEGMFDGSAALKRPLFGWRTYVLALIGLGLAVVVLAADITGTVFLVGALALFIAGNPCLPLLWGAVPVGVTAITALIVVRRRIKRKSKPGGSRSWRRKAVLDPLLTSIGFERSLLSNFYLRVRLFDLFRDSQVGNLPFPALLVAAPLQTLYRRENGKAIPVEPKQVWANPDARDSLLVAEALTATTAAPGIWSPVVAAGDDLRTKWQGVDSTSGLGIPDVKGPFPETDSIDIVDGAIVRKNPLPALLAHLVSVEGRDVRERLQEGIGSDYKESRVHMIYSTPLGDPVLGQDCLHKGPITDADANIVRVALLSRDLENRRDTELEVIQMNFVSSVAIATGDSKRVIAFADEIAPESSTRDEARRQDTNLLDPSRGPMLRRIAEGCRRTLGVLYRDCLPYGQPVRCREFLVQIAPQRPWNTIETPGLQEVCGSCTQILKHVPGRPELPASQLHRKFETLKGLDKDGKRRPRVVFVASGGVFRGAFHIGMIGALRTLNLRPDLVAGASVGTLMGGAMAALFSVNDDAQARRMLNRFVEVFENVDTRIALTKTLKNAARELGIRGRDIRLSPEMIRKMLRRGSQADAAYATTGSPPALIDAISRFLAIPINRTRDIASDFVAGLVAQATGRMLEEMQRFTLPSLKIEEAILGASLLENEARALISQDADGKPIPSVDTRSAQPFQADEIAFVASATNLGGQAMALLWDNNAEFCDFRYDFIKAALASSAFPAVFRPIRASEIFPGAGRFDVRYSDGGLFDNLPFLPAIQVLRAAQLQELGKGDPLQRLESRSEVPDLFLAGALDANPETDPHRDGPFHSFTDIGDRGRSVGKNGKIQSFLAEVNIVDKLIREMKDHPPLHAGSFVNEVVNPAILAVFPADKHHLNPTFSFSGTTGFNPKRVLGSIADGCFQTWSQFARYASDTDEEHPHTAEGRALKARGVRRVTKRLDMNVKSGVCPFFQIDREPIPCPFAALNGPPKREKRLYEICKQDEKHHDA